MNTMKVAQINKPGGTWELVERDVPQPGTGQGMISGKARFRVVLTMKQ